MKVNDGDSTQRSESKERKGEKRRDEASRDQKRQFSELMDKRRVGRGERTGDERTRRLQEGRVQKEERQRDARRGERNREPPDKARQRDEPRRARGDEPRSRERRASGEQQRGEGRRAADDSRPASRSEADDATLEQRTDDLDDRAPGGVDANAIRPDREGAGAGRDAVGAVGESIGDTRQARQTENTEGASSPIDEVARRILDAVRVGHDGQARRVVFLDITVPGRGDVRIRLRRDGGDGFEVRMRADNDALAQTLQRGTSQLRAQGRDNGIDMTSIRVVR